MNHCHKLVSSGTNKKAWLSERSKKVTATDVGALLGKNPYSSPLDVFQNKRFGSKFVGNIHTDRGQKWEDAIIDHWAKITGRKVKHNKDFWVSNKYPWLGCTPDAFTINTITTLDTPYARIPYHKTKIQMLEIKCPNKMWGNPPDYYLWQVRTQMLVMGISEATLVAAAINSTDTEIKEMKEWPVELTDDHEKLIIAASWAFYCALQSGVMSPLFWESFGY